MTRSVRVAPQVVTGRWWELLAQLPDLSHDFQVVAAAIDLHPAAYPSPRGASSAS